MKSNFGSFFSFLLFTCFGFGQANITIEVSWGSYAEENRVRLRNPANTTLGTVCVPSNCYNDDLSNLSYDNIASPASFNVPYGTGYSLRLQDRYGDGWNGSSYVRVYQDGTLIVTSDLTSASALNVSFDVNAPVVSDLAVTKTVDNNTPSEGSNITYTLSITNNGPSNATNVSLTDVLPPGVSFVSDDGAYNSGTGLWTIGTLNNGATATLNITASVDGSTSGTTITNTITTISADQTDSNVTGDDLSESITPTVDQPPVLTVTGDQQYCPGTVQAIVETISITDPDDTTTDAIYIQISSGYITGEDTLTLSGSHLNIGASFDPLEGELTLLGPATLAEFEAAVLAVEFSSSSVNPTGSRQFSITPGSANYLPSTGHYYEFISSLGITWTAARDVAALRTYFGQQGYLATLTTQAEADFSGSQAQGVGWIGGSDAVTEGDWQWVTGPEAGTSFWNGGIGGTELTFAF